MEIVDFPFPANLPIYMDHTDVKKYIEDFAEHFNLKNFIKVSIFERHICLLTNSTTYRNKYTWK